MNRRILRCAAVLALCCLVSGTVPERGACCPAPPELACIEAQLRAMAGSEKEQGVWLYSYQILCVP